MIGGRRTRPTSQDHRQGSLPCRATCSGPRAAGAIAVCEAQKLVGRGQLAADVLGKQGDVERLEKLQESVQLARESRQRARGLVADDVDNGLVVFPEPHDVTAKVVLIHGNATAYSDELLEGDVSLNVILEGPPTTEALARTLGGGEERLRTRASSSRRCRLMARVGGAGQIATPLAEHSWVNVDHQALEVALGNPGERRTRSPLLQDAWVGCGSVPEKSECQLIRVPLQ